MAFFLVMATTEERTVKKKLWSYKYQYLQYSIWNQLQATHEDDGGMQQTRFGSSWWQRDHTELAESAAQLSGELYFQLQHQAELIMFNF